jgi:hypothetical protein
MERIVLARRKVIEERVGEVSALLIASFKSTLNHAKRVSNG